jgi:hypothetical protein
MTFKLDKDFEVGEFAIINGIKMKKLGNLFQMTLPPKYIGTDWIDDEKLKYSTSNQNINIAYLQNFQKEYRDDLEFYSVSVSPHLKPYTKD